MARPADQALVASDQARAGLGPSGFDPSRIATIVSGLSAAQRAYLTAVAAAGGRPYHARHGRTANWALRKDYVESLVILAGRVGRWEDFTLHDRIEIGITEILGQVLTPLGGAIADAIATEARRAETTGSVEDEGAGPKDIAQS